ncbi:MAG: MBL fold metallo-hydrolase [Candidatus Thorarchaeota archaeon]
MVQNIEIRTMANESDRPYSITRIEQNQTNCYLIEVDNGFILIDTGYTKYRQEIEDAIASLGCTPGNLKLIVLTHGDFDHTGNSEYFRRKFNCKIAMHSVDIGMVEKGDFFWNRENRAITKILGRLMISILRMKLKKEDRFTPDILLDDKQDLSEFGLDASIIHTPGHSKGSIGILTKEGDFFCGDLFVNTTTPRKNTMLSNSIDYEESIKKIGTLQIQRIYPGHGLPFDVTDILSEVS